VSSNSDLCSLRFLFRHTRLDPLERDDHFVENDEEQLERELETADTKHDIEKDDL